uniref:glycerol-3-phosphate dehydrogenase C-terminal domain-containing protein n=1 Tax=Nonomuraea rhizosphaerae TaxID=2665663 RepID=UPI0024849D59
AAGRSAASADGTPGGPPGVGGMPGAGDTPGPAPAHLVARYGSEAAAVHELVRAHPEEVALGVTMGELVWAARHEGALDADDLLDRRTRIGLVPQDRAAALPAARAVFAG